MLPDIEKLLELQKADREIRKLRDEVAALPKRVSVIEAKLAGTKSHLEKARAAVKGDEASRKKFETSIQDLQGKISKYRDQSLDVKTNEHSCQRILYFDPASETVQEQEAAAARAHQRKRPRPKSDASQAWFYRPDYGEEGEVLLVFTNSGGSASRRIFDMHTGRQIGDILVREGSYRLAFPEDFPDSVVRLNGHWDESAMDEWESELPSHVLDSLHSDLRAAQHESAQKPTPAAHAASQHPAAS
jgi:hypothetical protein